MNIENKHEPENKRPSEAAIELTLADDTTNDAPTGDAPTGDAPSGDSPTGDYTMGMLCHLLSLTQFLIPTGNIIGPLILWIVKKDQDAFVDATGKEVLNFQISMTIYALVCILLFFVIIGMLLLPVLMIVNIVFTIIAAIKANEGQLYRYPFTIRFIK